MMAHDAISQVMARCPDLTIDGLNGRKRENFDERREALLSESGVREFEIARVWLSEVPARATPNKVCDSYRVKHVIETWAGTYVANGACIAAALSIGIAIAECPSGINAWLGIAGQRKWP
ncbi:MULTISPECIES: hypothetical protein [Rhodopseudomonas]|uniref:Uncharacterized protein n=1 Tax=Rhodopseudomonas palustris TaxID=1076 RepID=A0A0D7EER8_RHOPL|nr:MULTISPECIES: hypothetical protein [Rhodopseudomonas]KIZ38072.1 hypothetical protein OO17_23175 [Rhodopseudomonas palustris]MDF3810551.1 hypothetical protein [Rhodopseudomonas sp. BAL398]WOK18391.1 hypothetical protein RBJ75_02335 [Rhodopseudomonas sp. BAL398]